ncbi:hypothetical protein D3C86_1246500 [compost metagenome]
MANHTVDQIRVLFVLQERVDQLLCGQFRHLLVGAALEGDVERTLGLRRFRDRCRSRRSRFAADRFFLLDRVQQLLDALFHIRVHGLEHAILQEARHGDRSVTAGGVDVDDLRRERLLLFSVQVRVGDQQHRRQLAGVGTAPDVARQEKLQALVLLQFNFGVDDCRGLLDLFRFFVLQAHE